MKQKLRFRVGGGGTLYTLRPMNKTSRAQLVRMVEAGACWWGGALCVEWRYFAPLVDGLARMGAEVQ